MAQNTAVLAWAINSVLRIYGTFTQATPPSTPFPGLSGVHDRPDLGVGLPYLLLESRITESVRSVSLCLLVRCSATVVRWKLKRVMTSIIVWGKIKPHLVACNRTKRLD